VYGIADSLATNAVAQAQKGDVPVYVVPTDQKEGFVETTLPTRIDRRECKLCNPCTVVDICSYSAVRIIDRLPRIDSGLCQGCGLCVTSCQFGAVKISEKKKLRIRKVDVNNVEKLQLMHNMTVLEHPQQIEKIIKKL
jgi:dihydromethanopterin reductase (acceptor)